MPRLSKPGGFLARIFLLQFSDDSGSAAQSLVFVKEPKGLEKWIMQDAKFRLNVLNPRGRDLEQHFDGAANGAGHAPVNFHAYAACTGGSFFRDVTRAVGARLPVLLLLRGDFRDSERALNFLKKAGMTVAVSLKETGLHQIANQMVESSKLSRFLRIVAQADGCIAPTPEAADFYRTIKGKDSAVAFVPTPYPVHDKTWQLSRPIEERRGILVGTREWEIPSRNHLAALTAARQIGAACGEPVAVFNLDGRKGERLLSHLGFSPDQLRVRKRAPVYSDYLRVVGEHKIIFQLDTSFVPGQVAGDALLCGIPCVGGNGAIDRIGFPELCGAGRSIAELVAIAVKLMQDATFYRAAVTASQDRAAEHLSFSKVAKELEDFVAGLERAALSAR